MMKLRLRFVWRQPNRWLTQVSRVQPSTARICVFQIHRAEILVVVDGSASHFYPPPAVEGQAASMDTFCGHFGESDAYGQ